MSAQAIAEPFDGRDFDAVEPDRIKRTEMAKMNPPGLDCGWMAIALAL
jgi:hypothetical protein